MKIDLENLNWNEATVLDGRYIYYLALMLDERCSAIGFSDFNINEFTPTGVFRYKELYDIYTLTLRIGQSMFLNEANLSDTSFKNHKIGKYFSFTLKDLCTISGFDFFSHPLIPNQRLNFYDKFLKPLYLILKEFKKIFFNRFDEITPTSYIGVDTTFPNATDLTGGVYPHVVNHIQQNLNGPELVEFYSFQNLKDREIISPDERSLKGIVGGLTVGRWCKDDWLGYYETYWSSGTPPPVPPHPPVQGGHWEFISARGMADIDLRYYPSAVTDDWIDGQSDYNIRTGGTDHGGYVSFRWDKAVSHNYQGHADENLKPVWEPDPTDPGPVNWDPIRDYWDLFTTGYEEPQSVSWSSLEGEVTVHWKVLDAEIDDTRSYLGVPTIGEEWRVGFGAGTPPSNINEHNVLITMNVVLKYVADDPQPTPTPGPDPSPTGWQVSWPEYALAENYEGAIWEFYNVKDNMKFMAPCALRQNLPYNLYLYYDAGHYEGYESEINLVSKYSFSYAPSGDLMLYESGTIDTEFKTFDVSIPKYFFDQPNISPCAYFNNGAPTSSCIDVLSTLWQDVEMAVYAPYDYDQTYWTAVGTTPRQWKGQQLPQGRYLHHEPRGLGERNVTVISMFYRPLLIIDLTSTLKYT